MKKNYIFYSTIVEKDIDIRDLIRAPSSIQVKKGKHALSYLELNVGFDIETTTIKERAYMYIWQVAIGDFVIFGRSWCEFIDLLEQIKKVNKLSDHKRVIVWVANLSFETQFMRKHLNVTKVFAKKERHPMYLIHDDCIEFRDALLISGGSLDQLAKNYTKTQKMVGDLDYSLVRNSKTKLDDIELKYCMNDVLILSEFSEYIWKNYIEKYGYCPLTKTQILRKEIEMACGDVKEVKKKVAMLTCGENFYKFAMQYLFRGGYVHGNIFAIYQVIMNVVSYDITSSYPWAMVSGYYAMSQFVPIEFTEENLKKYCCIVTIEFTNIRSKTAHSIESQSKCLKLDNPVIDNGRVSSADKMTVCLTELDFLSYKEFYEWDDMNVIQCMGSHRGKLPKYVVMPMLNHYISKADLKRKGLSDTKEYAIEKQKVNSFYGMMVSRMVDDEITYINNEWDTVHGTLNYDRSRNNLLLSPFWGIWVTAHARRNLLSIVSEIGDTNIYNDTDSFYAKWSKEVLDIVEKRNKLIKAQQKIAFEYYGINGEDADLCADLGLFDYDGLYDFKTLGAKRYVKRNVWTGKVKSTIAGLPKRYFDGKPWQEVVTEFTDEMYAEHAYKLRAVYNDEPHGEMVTDYQGNTVFMEELSSVALVDADFTLRLDAVWCELIKEVLKERNEWHE